MAKWQIVQHVPHESPGKIINWLQSSGEEYIINRAWVEQSIRSMESYQGLILMGGPMSANEGDRYPYLRHEMSMIETCLREEKPILGVCLGSQLLAKVLGACVYRGPQPEIGWYPVQFTPQAESDSLFRGKAKERWMFHWHGETFDLSRGATLLASSELYPHQAFRYGKLAYGVQFHFEVTEDMVEEWLEVNSEEVARVDVSLSFEILSGIPQYLHGVHAFGSQLINGIGQLIK